MIDFIKAEDKVEGNLKAHDILKKIVDGQTLLALSGGTSPDYESMLAAPDDIISGAICVVDERYGEEFHKDSNELLLKEQGIGDFVKVLHSKGFEETARLYNEAIEGLFEKFPKRVGVMGVGKNLHTAGIFPDSTAAHSPDLVVAETVDDKFPQRISLTLKALGQFQNFVVLMFGSAKQNALKILLDEGENDMQKYPAIFFRKAPVKTYLITDIEQQG